MGLAAMTTADLERADPAIRADSQMARLGQMIRQIHGRNEFYTRKFDQAGIHQATFNPQLDFAKLPLTTKGELVADQLASPPWGTALSEPLDRYTRYNQTSSTTGSPLRWIDTNESWQWMLDCWKAVYRAANVGAHDRILFPFSFGPFLGFWTAFEAGCQIDAHCIPAGGLSSEARLMMVDTLAPTVVCCTPTYALRLAEVAASGGGAAGHPLADSSVRVRHYHHCWCR
jgi:phenylacetate-CoA ligase